MIVLPGSTSWHFGQELLGAAGGHLLPLEALPRKGTGAVVFHCCLKTPASARIQGLQQ